MEEGSGDQALKGLRVMTLAAARRVLRAEHFRLATSSVSRALRTLAGFQRWAMAVARISGAWRRMCGSRSRRSRISTSAGTGGAVLVVFMRSPRAGGCRRQGLTQS